MVWHLELLPISLVTCSYHNLVSPPENTLYFSRLFLSKVDSNIPLFDSQLFLSFFFSLQKKNRLKLHQTLQLGQAGNHLVADLRLLQLDLFHQKDFCTCLLLAKFVHNICLLFSTNYCCCCDQFEFTLGSRIALCCTSSSLTILPPHNQIGQHGNLWEEV